MAVVSFTFIRILVQFFERSKAQEKPSRTGAHARIAGYSNQSTYLRAWASCAYILDGLPEPL